MTVCDSEPVDRGRLRLPLALIAAVAVAEAAVLLLRPRDGVIEPAHVSAGSYFSPQEIERAQDFRRPQLALYGGTLLVEGALLAWLVLRPPRRLRGPFRRPLATAALAGATLSLALEAAPLPLTAVARQRSIDVGLSTQSWGDWAGDVAKSWGIGAVLAGAGAAMGIGLMRRFGPRWWLPGSALVVAVGAGFIYAGPVVLDPVFNKFTPLPEGRTRSDVLELARRAGVKVGEVYEVDASRRTTAANAYVTGLGSTKRVVLYDTLIENFTREETRLVVAHELAHVRHRDVPHGLLYLAIVAPFALLATARLTDRLAPGGPPGPATLPALALSIAVVSLPVTIVSNQLSRRIEARADSFSLRLTNAPESFVSFERRITLRNVSEPDPPAWLHALLATHPTTVQRIGIAKAFEAGRR
jgi:STE24 endopeptidase